MHLDDEICYCFHVTWRKLIHFCRITKPQVPSRLAECGGAGTGCGWCIPFLKKIFRSTCGQGDPVASLERLDAATYARQRAAYIRAGRGQPPPGATPLPEEK
ncbi:MAG: (2Fe-2S)-binding protein [Gemmataceae bacterium]